METSVILAIITIAGNILLALIQLRSTIAAAKEKESSAASILIERALAVAENEVKYLKELNAALAKKISEQELLINEQKAIIESLKNRLKEDEP